MDVGALFQTLALAQQPTTSGGAAGTASSGSNNKHGGNATGFGCGGGGAGWYGGNGGSGLYGGGGGGAASVSDASLTGGSGGQGVIVIAYILPPAEPPPPQPPSGPTRVSAFAYDANTGLLTQEVIEPDTPALRLQTDYTYDAFGHKVEVTVSGGDIAARTATTTYDAKGQFPVSASNALSHTESWEYDLRFGTPTKHTGPNGLTTQWTYDGFGRKTLELRADGTRTTWSYLYCAGTAGGTASCPAGATHLVEVKALGPDGSTKIGPTATQYYDQLDRVIAVDTEGFDGSLTRTGTVYDALGRVAKESRPYFVSSGTPEWITYTYDALGRVVSETQPNSAVTTNTYHGLTTSVTNAASQTSTTTKNGQGQVVQVKDAQNNIATYAYDPFGNLAKATDAAGNVTTFAYDTRGRRVTASDPDLGTSTYTYDVLDKLKAQTNAASEVTTLSYDLLGRLVQRVEPGLTSTWTWDAGTKGIGKLASASTNGGYTRAHTYDALGRPDQVQITVNSATHAITTAYDAASRVSKVTYPSGFAVTYGYNPTGYQHQLTNAATSEVYWTANARDAELHLTQQTAGNGVVTTQLFDPKTGRLTQVVAGDAVVQNQTYDYDPLGKLTKRTDANTGLEETFAYDPLNRLISSTVHNKSLVSTFAYNAIGNMISKSDVGTYSYPDPGQPRPHGVTSISGGVISTTFSYDTKGNMTSGNGLGVTYTAFNKPATITRGTASISFDHDPEHQRYAQTSLSGVTLYLSGGGVLAERFAGSGGIVRWTNYLIVGGRLIGIHVESSDETTLTRYFHHDHLGSIAVITQEAGVGAGIVVERLSYDAWGQRRQPDGTPDPSGSIASQSSRGFTGHEHLAEVGLIHMNGRVYDPLLARFGTPDPMTEDPFSTQGWNRYTYVGNSPVNFTDPTGYCFLGCFWKPIFKAIGQFFQKYWGTIVQIAAGVICSMVPGCQPFLVAGLASFAVTGITSGNLGLALKAGFISMVTSFVAQNVLGGMTSNNAAATGPATGFDDWGPMMRLCPAYGPCGPPPVRSPNMLPPISVSAPSARSVLNAVPGFEASSIATQSALQGNLVTAGVATVVAGVDIWFGGAVSTTSRGVRYIAQSVRSGAALLSEGMSNHHSVLRRFGGHETQVLHPLDDPVHREFHDLLNKKLVENGFPPGLAANGSAAQWERYFMGNVGSQDLAFDLTLDAARVIDQAYGTSITQYTWRNLMFNRWTAIPDTPPIPRLGQ